MTSTLLVVLWTVGLAWAVYSEIRRWRKTAINVAKDERSLQNEHDAWRGTGLARPGPKRTISG
jgi:hypothetical protein